MPLTWTDWTILAIILISALISVRRGLLREALSLVIWGVAGVVAWMFGASLAPHLESYIQTPSLRILAASALIFVLVLLLGGLAGFLLGELVRVTGLSGTDRFLGMFFGAARGLLLITVLVGVLDLAPVHQDRWWQDSQLIPRFLQLADWLKAQLPDLDAFRQLQP